MKSPSGKPSEDIEKIRRELLELDKKLVDLQGGELLRLRERVSDLESRGKWIRDHKRVVATVAVFLGLGTLAGIYTGIKASVNMLVTTQAEAIKRDFTKQLNEYMEETVCTNDQIQQAVTLFNKDYARGLAVFRKLAEEKQESELLFMYYTDGLLMDDKHWKDAFLHWSDLKANKMTPPEKKWKFPGSYCNSGTILWVKFAMDGPDDRLARDARKLLETALEKAYSSNSYEDVLRASFYLALLHLSQDSLDEARDHGRRFVDRGGDKKKLLEIQDTEWFKRLAPRIPDIQKRLREVFPGGFTESKVEAVSQ